MEKTVFILYVFYCNLKFVLSELTYSVPTHACVPITIKHTSIILVYYSSTYYNTATSLYISAPLIINTIIPPVYKPIPADKITTTLMISIGR